MGRLKASDGTYPRPEGVPEGSVLSVFRVAPEDEGQRLDVFLTSELRRTSRTRTQFIIRNSAFGEHGRRLRPNDRVFSEQRILLWRPPWDEDPVPTEVPIVFEDGSFFAVNKPPLLPVHPTARYFKNTLIKVLEAERPGEFVSLVHRLDRETSGLLMVAKDAATDRALKKQLEAREGIDKTYLAVTWGIPANCRFGETYRCEAPVELDPVSRYKVKMRIGKPEEAMYAATRFTVLAIAGGETESLPPYALVQCDLETGRQHQIRLHLASLGAPIVGDKLYGPDESAFARGADGELTEDDFVKLELPRHALHAFRLVIRHPHTNERLDLRAPLPRDIADFFEARGGTIPDLDNLRL